MTNSYSTKSFEVVKQIKPGQSQISKGEPQKMGQLQNRKLTDFCQTDTSSSWCRGNCLCCVQILHYVLARPTPSLFKSSEEFPKNRRVNWQQKCSNIKSLMSHSSNKLFVVFTNICINVIKNAKSIRSNIKLHHFSMLMLDTQIFHQYWKTIIKPNSAKNRPDFVKIGLG